MNQQTGDGAGASRVERFCFDGVVVDAVAHTLSRADQPLSVEPKAFAVLLLLLRHAGELVPRDDLLDQVWGHRHVTPGVLTRVIAQLRHALDDDPHNPRYIQTLHALGYRFVGKLERDPSRECEGPADAGAGAVTGESDAAAFPADRRGPPRSNGEITDTRTSGDRRRAVTVPQAVPDDRNRRGVGKPWRRRRLLVAAIALLATLAGALFWFQWRPPLQSAAPAEASVAVLPFTNLSTERDDQYFAEGLAIEMHDALAGVPGLKVAAQPLGSAARAQPDIRRLGKTLGVATVLAASVRREGGRVRINARLSDTRSGFTLWSKSYEREATDVFALQSEIANHVVESLLGLLPTEQPRLSKRLAPTGNAAAYESYVKGLRLLQSPGEGDAIERAIELFEKALAADAGFARAQAGICRAEIERFESVRNPTAFARAQAACEVAAKMDPQLREVSLAQAELHRTQGQIEPAIALYTKALDDISLRPAAYVGLARVQSALGDNTLTLDYFQRARDLRPGDSAIYRELGYHQYLTGDVPRAIESFRAAATLQPDDASAWNSLGGLYLANGDTVQASEAFHRSLAIKPSYGALSNLGTLKYSEGNYTAAAQLYRRAAELDPDDFRVWGNIGDALSAQPGTAPKSRDAYQRAARMASEYVAIKADDAQALALLAWYHANLGDGVAARAALASAEALSTERAEIAFLGAQAMARLGDEPSARRRLAAALAEGIPPQRIATSPVLRPLSIDRTPTDDPGANAHP